MLSCAVLRPDLVQGLLAREIAVIQPPAGLRLMDPLASPLLKPKLLPTLKVRHPRCVQAMTSLMCLMRQLASRRAQPLRHPSISLIRKELGMRMLRHPRGSALALETGHHFLPHRL